MFTQCFDCLLQINCLFCCYMQVYVYPEDSRMEGEQEMYVFSAQADEGQIVGLRLYGNTLQVRRVPYIPTCA